MIGRLAHLLRMQAPVVDNRGLLYLSGATVPTDDSDGYQTGCIFQHTDGGDDTALYVNEGSVTACDFNPVTVGAAGEMSQIEFNDDLTGPLISIDTTDPTGASYETPFIITGTYSSTCALALQLSITNQRPVSFLFDDGGSVLGSGNYRAVLSRVMLCSTQTGQVAIRAIRGQVKVADGLALNIGASEFNSINGVEGYMELAGATGRTVGANTRVAALHSLTEIRQDITLTAGGKVCGLLVELAQTTAKTVDGIGSAAIAVDRVDSDHADVQADWDIGLVFGDSSVTTGVKIGVCTSGIVLTGVTGRAIDIATSGVFRMGIEGTGVSVNNTYPYGLEIHTKTTTDFAQPATGVSAGIYSRYEHSFDQVTATGHAAVFAKLRVKKDLVDGVHAASYNYVEVSGGANTDIGGTATTQTTAGMFSIETDTGFILSDGLLSGIIVDSSIHVTGTFSGTISGVRIQKSGTGKAWPTGIQIVASATETGIAIGTCATAAVHILGDQAIGILFDVDASATDGLKMSVDTSMTLTEGIEISGAGTVTTGITLAMDLSTTGILISAAACATGISITAGSLTDGIKVSATTPEDGIEVSSACTQAAFHSSAASAVGLLVSGACTTAAINITAANLNCIKSVFNVGAQLGQYVQGIKMEHTRSADIQPSTGGWWGAQIVLNAGTGYTALDKTAYVLHCIFKGDATNPSAQTVNVARFETQSNGKVEDLLFVSANAGSTVEGDVARFVAHVAPTRSILAVQNGTVGSTPIGICVDIDETMTTGIQFNTGAAITNLLQITAAANTSYFLIADAEAGCLPNYSSAGSAIANLKVKIGTTDGYIKIYDAA